jgi:hypothetical protein
MRKLLKCEARKSDRRANAISTRKAELLRLILDAPLRQRSRVGMLTPKVASTPTARIHPPTEGITMATSPILDFIDSRTNRARRNAKSAIVVKKEKGSVQCGGPSSGRQRSAAYIYAIIVDGIVRYIGKGRNGRMYTHLIEAKRTSARCPASTAHLGPRMHRKLVETVRSGSQIIETVIKSGLTESSLHAFPPHRTLKRFSFRRRNYKNRGPVGKVGLTFAISATLPILRKPSRRTRSISKCLRTHPRPAPPSGTRSAAEVSGRPGGCRLHRIDPPARGR